MRTAKQQFAKDIQRFVNCGEFAETHTIDNLEVKAIIDSDALSEREPLMQSDGVYSDSITVYVSSDEYQSRPVFGQAVNVDGKRYICQKSTDEDGILIMILSSNTGWGGV